MFKFMLEKFLISFMPFLAAFSFFLALVYAFYVVASVAPPEKAEFVQEMRYEAEKNPHDIADLSQPHMTNTELQNWLTMAISESLTINKSTYQDVLAKIRPYYTDEGFFQFEQYLSVSGIAENIQINPLEVSVFTKDLPILYNSSVIEGKYRWLFQVPLTISFLPMGGNNKEEDLSKYVNKDLTVRLQLTRNKVNDDINAIQIESWVIVAR